MTLIAGKLIGLAALVPVTGLGVAYPAIKLLNANQTITYKNSQDFKNNCWVSMVGGDEGQYSGQNRKLLVCPVGSNSSIAKFYFYNTSFENSQELPKKVKGLQEGENHQDITLTFDESGKTEVIGVSNRSWKFLYKEDLSNVCSIVKETDGVYIRCAGHTVSTKLTKFD